MVNLRKEDLMLLSIQRRSLYSTFIHFRGHEKAGRATLADLLFSLVDDYVLLRNHDRSAADELSFFFLNHGDHLYHDKLLPFFETDEF